MNNDEEKRDKQYRIPIVEWIILFIYSASAFTLACILWVYLVVWVATIVKGCTN